MSELFAASALPLDVPLPSCLDLALDKELARQSKALAGNCGIDAGDVWLKRIFFVGAIVPRSSGGTITSSTAILPATPLLHDGRGIGSFPPCGDDITE